MADIAIRQLRKKGFSEDTIETILALAYMQFSSTRYKVYRTTLNSQLFLETVHDILENYEFSIDKNNKKEIINLYPLQKQGFIHILADNKKKDVWWGKEREINE